MNIIVIGAGKVGTELIEQLSAEQHNIAVIDVDPEAIRLVSDRWDVLGLVGNGAAGETLVGAGVEKADLLIATTNLDELNILSCIIAKQLGAGHTIARVRNPEYAGQMSAMRRSLGLSMLINPDMEAAGEISRMLRYQSALKVSTFTRGRAELIEVRLGADNPLVGMALRDFRNKYQLDILICAVQRGDEVVIPGGEFVMRADDHVSLLGTPFELDRLLQKIRLFSGKTRNVMIVGGSRIAHYLAKQITDMGMHVKIIEQDRRRCRELCQALPNVTVIEGNGGDQELLHEEGIEGMDAFVSLTGLDEENMIMSMYAADCGVPRVITKINNLLFPAMLSRMGLERVVSVKRVTADRIVRYVRAMQDSSGNAMETLYKLVGGRVEAIEFHVGGDLPFLGIPLKKLNIKRQTLIGCIVRRSGVLIPSGNTTIERGDNVIVISGGGTLSNFEDIIAR